MPVTSRPVGIYGRDNELASLRALLERARRGHGGALTIAAEPGMGKSALVQVAQAEATDFRILGTSGVPSETPLPLAGLHGLLAPLTEPLPALPPRQAEAVAQIAGRGDGGDIDPFALCVAVHRLLTDAAKNGPVLCWVDDTHCLDRVSLEALAFTARRCAPEPIVMLFATDQRTIRDDNLGEYLAEIPCLRLGPLDEPASERVLDEQLVNGVSEDLAQELLELGSGNPLALVELVHALTPEQLGGEVPAPTCLPPYSRQRGHLRRRFDGLSEDARLLVMLALADDWLDCDTTLRAVRKAGLDLLALKEAETAGILVVDGESVELPTELLRSTLHSEASLSERQAAHELLASVLDKAQHRLRWAWHQAAIGDGQRGRLADELADAAVAASWSGDHAASSRALARAAALTPELDAKALRLIAAGADSWLSGRTWRSRTLLRQARPLARSPELRGVTDLLRGGIELCGGVPAMANRTLLNAAEQLLGTNRMLAVTSLMFAGEASCVAGDYQGYYAAARRAIELGKPDDPPAMRLMLDHFTGMAATFQGDHEKAAGPLRRVVRFADVVADSASSIWASQAAFTLGNSVQSLDMATRALNITGGHGIEILAPWALVYHSMSALLLDRYPSAEASSLEGLRTARALGQHNSAVDHLTILALLAALQGDRETALLRLNAAADGVAMRGLGRPAALSSWAFACVDLVGGRPADAMDRFRRMTTATGRVNAAIRAMAAPQFVEAAVRCGQRTRAVQALETFDHWASTTGSAARLALSQRCHALVAETPADAGEHFREAIRLHRTSDTALELAKTELLYAYQLRRARKPRAARELLAEAVKIFQQYHADHWIEQAQAELRAAGETVDVAAPATIDELTPQQAQISRLVSEGATNREIAGQLFISQRTVDYHLRNIFAKLGVRSRVELSRLLR